MTDEPGFGVERMSTTETPPAAAVSAREQETEWGEKAERLSSVCSLRVFTPAEGEEAVDVLLRIPALLAEVEQLREERDKAVAGWQEAEHPFDASEHRAAVARALAAEAVVEQQTAALRAFFVQYDGDHGEFAPSDKVEAQLRAALRAGAE